MSGAQVGVGRRGGRLFPPQVLSKVSTKRHTTARRTEYISSNSSVRQSRFLGRIEESRHWSSGTLDRLNIHTVFSVWLSVVDKFVRVHLSQLPLPADG